MEPNITITADFPLPALHLGKSALFTSPHVAQFECAPPFPDETLTVCSGVRGGEGAVRNDFLLLILLVNFSSKGGGLDVLSQTLFSGAFCDTRY